MPRARSDNIFDPPRTSYQPRVAPLESRIRQLDQLQRIQHGTDHRLLINPQLITAHRWLEEHLHRESVPHQAANGDGVDDSMDHDFTPQENEHPTLVNRLRDHHTDFEQQARHQSRNRRWIELIPTLHGAFISLRDETKNWTTSDAFKDRSSHFCDCEHSKYRYVDLVDLYSQKREFIRFCNCTPDPLRLLARGYIGSTPTAPETAFSLHLLGFHDHLWQWCNVGTQPFMKTMEAWLEEQSKPLLTEKGNRRDLQVNFSASVDVYRTLMNRTNDMFIDTLNLTKEQRLALDVCAACFGPSPCPPANLGGQDLDTGAPSTENEAGTETQTAEPQTASYNSNATTTSNPNATPTSDPNATPTSDPNATTTEPPATSSEANPTAHPRRAPLAICLDGNFQQRHHLAAGKNYLGLITPNNFISPVRIAQMADSIKLQEQLHRIRGGRDRCADSHKAADDKRNKSTWKACDDTGLMGCCCRHDASVYMANISDGGKNRKYPLSILNEVLGAVDQNREVRVLYDISCNLKKFIDLRHLFPEDQHRLRFGTSVFHSYVHNWKCQLEFSPRYNTGWGLTDGEGLERLWSYLSPLVSPLRYATRNHRLAALAHKLRFHNQRGTDDLISWIQHKYSVAIQRQREGNETLNSLYHKTNQFANQRSPYNLSFFEAQWASQRQFQLTHTESDRERQEQLAAFLDREASLNRLRTQLNESLTNNLSNFDDIIESLLEIASGVEAQENVARTLPAEHTILIGQDLPRRRLQLMLWHSKSQLYTHAVELFSERQPLYRGTHIGTTLSTRIMAAVDRRKKPIESAIRKYNGYRAEYWALLPPNEQQEQESDNRDLNYHNFINMSLDDPFWQDVYLYNSREPWACNSDVRAGIQAMLTVQRADEELSFLQDELSTALLWAVHLHKSIKDKIEAIDAVELPEGADENDSDDDEMEGRWGHLLPSIDLGECGDAIRAQLVLNVLHERLTKHETIMLGWAADAKAMWLELYGEILPSHEWFNLITTLSSGANNTIFSGATVVEPNEDIAAGEEGDEVEASELLSLMGVHQI
ncbi:hypothetical protein Pst134EB_014678 [Puccinia striiformis f. sp. tritici]|nr:hypothetical protein Pst134EB_014678 [Puccinia striiformis f. sp. tritici]